MISATHLASFVAVAQAGSVTGAAELLSYSTSAVSAHVKYIERRLGTRLVRRTGSGCALTHEGQRVAELARGILEQYDALWGDPLAPVAASAAAAGPRRATGTEGVASLDM
jgi:DNA-binding transcriptional LysR family regulator